MSRSRLIRTTGEFPPGSYSFQDKITGKQYLDQHTTFDERVKQIINDRRANQRLFTDPRLLDFGYVSNELSESVCARLGNDPRFCAFEVKPVMVTNTAGVVVQYVPGKVCRQCGSEKLSPVYCATCGGSKIASYKCEDCGADNLK